MSGFVGSGLSSTHAQVVLNAIKDGLRVVLTSPTYVEPGQPVTAALVPASHEIDASELANGALNLAWSAKDVIFSSQALIDVPSQGDMDGDIVAGTAAVLGGQPLPLPLGVVGGSTTPTTANVPGMLGQLFGSLSVPRLKVRAGIRWIVRKDGQVLNEGEDFTASQGLGSPTVSLLLPPIVSELRLDTLENPPTEVRCLTAEVTLRLGTEVLGPFEVGPVPVLILPLLIPTVVVLFLEPNLGLSFEGTVVVVVPEHSPFASAEPLFRTLRKIEAVVAALKSLRGFATFFLGLDALIGSVPDQPRFRFRAADGIPKLGNITVKKGRYVLGITMKKRVTFNNKTNSILVFGLPGTKVQFYNDRGYRTTTTTPSSKMGTYVVQVGPQFVVAIRDLETPRDEAPLTLPPGSVTFFEPALSYHKRWHNGLSSLKFDDGWLAEVRKVKTSPPRLPALVCPPPRLKGGP